MQLARPRVPRYTRQDDGLSKRVEESKRLSTARTYWELKAEQVMNRVFDPVLPAYEVVAIEMVEASTTSKDHKHKKDDKESREAITPNTPTNKRVLERKPITTTIFLSSCVLLLTLIVVTIANQRQQILSELKDIQLQNRLRSLSNNMQDVQEANVNTHDDIQVAPPPPLHEAWMETLSELPGPIVPPSTILKVPMPGKIGSTTSPRSTSNALPQEAIQLIGVVQAPGQKASGIFQTGTSSSSAMAGESIGNTGWKLKSANGETAIIERGGEQRRLGINTEQQ